MSSKLVSLLLNFLMLRMGLAPFAILLEIDLALDELAVLARPIIDAAALAARELEKLILRHNARHYTQNHPESQSGST